MTALPQGMDEEYVTRSIEKKVGELMLSLENFSTISINACLRDAVFVFKKLSYEQGDLSRAECLLVFKDKTLAGMLRMQDLLELVQPEKLREGWYQGWRLPGPWSEPLFFTGLFTRRCLQIADKPVGDVMFPFTFYLQRDDSLSRAIYLMFKHSVDLLPVREGNQVVGVLRACDLFDEAGRIMLNNG